MNSLDPQLIRFIEHHIHSVEQLEVLLLLRLNPSQTWDAEAVCKELRTSPQSALQRLVDLARRSLAQEETSQPGFYRYRSDVHEKSVHELAETYKKRRIAVIEQIFLRPKSDLVAFANAFDVRRREEE